MISLFHASNVREKTNKTKQQIKGGGKTATRWQFSLENQFNALLLCKLLRELFKFI
jgi:hypothetical protein